ncbi:polyhydroxyalkanoate synthesis repressor PhaR [Polynucleobacter paneuropaeus]|nr:polyhydroxyalkanoate synthesis repressor PhaR [Polynucleobacter paneuropaeus]
MRAKKQSEDGIRIITKYPNRRLYDRTDSQYIPFAGLKKLIKEGVVFKVIDEKTNEDVTRIVLTQIISEESIENNQFLSEDLLRQIIKFYENPMGVAMGLFLEKSMENFLTIQNQISKNSQVGTPGTNFGELLDESLKKNQEYLKEMQKVFFGGVEHNSNSKQ